ETASAMRPALRKREKGGAYSAGVRTARGMSNYGRTVRTCRAGKLKAPGPGRPAGVLIAGALVAGMQKKPTSVPVCVPHTPVRVIVSVKHGRAESVHVPEPGNVDSQSSFPVPGRHERNFWFEQRPSIGLVHTPLAGQRPSSHAFGRFWLGQKHWPCDPTATHA